MNAYNELRELVNKSNIPITTTLHGLGVFPEDNDLSLKMCGMHGSVYANNALQNADCIIAIGSRFDDRTTGNLKYYAPKAKDILHIDIESKQIGKVINDKRYKYKIGDAKEIMKEMITLIKRHLFSDKYDIFNWHVDIKMWKRKNPFRYSISKKLKTQQVIEEIGKQILPFSKDYIITTDVGSHQMWTAQYITWMYPRTMITSGSLGCMGVGTPYAIGSKIANPEKKVIAVCGDFSFDMSLNDLKTIKEYNIPIKIAVMNDGAQSMVWAWTQYFFEGRETGVLKKNKNFPKYADIAKGFGIESLVCDSIEDLESCIELFLEHEGPILCEFRTEKDKCLPLVKPGSALDEMVTFDNNNYSPSKNTLTPC